MAALDKAFRHRRSGEALVEPDQRLGCLHGRAE